MRLRTLSIPACLIVVTVLSGCSTVQRLTGQYEKVAAKNEAGQLITASAPTEGQSAPTSAPDDTSATMASNQVPDMGRAAKSLPGGLAGDTTNSNHIGDAVPPR
jgi:uncharacterized protein YceK